MGQGFVNYGQGMDSPPNFHLFSYLQTKSMAEDPKNVRQKTFVVNAAKCIQVSRRLISQTEFQGAASKRLYTGRTKLGGDFVLFCRSDRYLQTNSKAGEGQDLCGESASDRLCGESPPELQEYESHQPL